MARIPDKRQPFDPAKAARERAAASSERTVTLTPAQRMGKRPLLRPDKKPLLRDED